MVPSGHKVVQLLVLVQGFDALFWSLGTPGTYVVHIHTLRRNTKIKKITFYIVARALPPYPLSPYLSRSFLSLYPPCDTAVETLTGG